MRDERFEEWTTEEPPEVADEFDKYYEQQEEEKRKANLKFQWGNDVKDQEVSYLWYPYLINGNVNTFGGETGTGKTWVLSAIISAVTTDKQPEGMPGIIMKRGNVLYLGGEDGNAGMKERIIKTGGNPSKVALVENAFDCTSCMLIDYIDAVKPVLIVIDPLLSYVGKKTNINDYVGARKVLDHLRDVARKYDISILQVVHPPKNGNYKLLHRFTGSGAFVDAVRTATYIGYHPTDSNKRVGIQPKNNVQRTVPFVFELDPELGFMWVGEDENITSKEVEEATVYEKTSKQNLLGYYEKVITEVMRINPTEFEGTAKDILEEFSRVSGHNISPLSFGQALNKVIFIQALQRKNITLKKGTNGKNRQKYSLYYTESVMNL